MFDAVTVLIRLTGVDEMAVADLGAARTARDAARGRPGTAVADLHECVETIAELVRDSESDAIDQITALEEIKASTAAAQARATADLSRMRIARETALEVPREERGAGLAAEVALARKESPSKGSRHLGLAKVLVTELPQTLELMERGLVSEWRATILAQATACLTVEDRRRVDAALAPDLPTWGDTQVRNHARKLTQELDPDSALARHRRDTATRHVSVRPAHGAMGYLTALLPMTQAVRVYASLTRQSASVVSAGDPDGRTKGQIAADLLVEHVTGTGSTTPQDVDLTIVMPAETLAGGDEPAWLPGHGPVPAEVAREQVSEAGSVWFRRLWTDPAHGGVTSTESRGRTFSGQLRKLILVRDDVCSTPFCGAPIQVIDHSTPHAGGGATSFSNGSGLCASCNYAKENPGWRHDGDDEGGIDVYTPTGHRYRVPRSPFPYRPRPLPPPMTDQRYEMLKERVGRRVQHNRRSERADDADDADP